MLENHYGSQDKPGILEIIGKGSVTAQPNVSIISLGVVTEDLSLSSAQAENARKTTNVIQSLLNLGIPQNNIKTSNYTVDLKYSYDNGKQTFTGYRVNHQLKITNTNINQTGLIVDTAIRSGANEVTSIQFDVLDPSSYYQRALSLALKDAQQKATSIIQPLHVRLNPVPIKIQEVLRENAPVPLYTAAEFKAQATPIQPGTLEITATVRTEFRYQ